MITVADEGSALEQVVADGRFGQNVVPGKPALLANALRSLAQDQEQLRKWGKAGRVYVERFEQRKVLGKFVAELETLI